MNVAVVKEEAHEGVCWKNSSHIIGKYLPLASVFYFAVILLQIVLVSPGARLVKNHESLSITIEYQLKKNRVLNWKCFGLYVTRQLIWRQTPELSLLQFTEIKM